MCASLKYRQVEEYVILPGTLQVNVSRPTFNHGGIYIVGMMREGDYVEFRCYNLIKVHQDSSRRMIMMEFVHNFGVLGDTTPHHARQRHSTARHARPGQTRAGDGKPRHATLRHATSRHVTCVLM